MKTGSQFLVNGALVLPCEVEPLGYHLHQHQLGSVIQQEATPHESKHLFPSNLSDLWYKEWAAKMIWHKHTPPIKIKYKNSSRMDFGNKKPEKL